MTLVLVIAVFFFACLAFYWRAVSKGATARALRFENALSELFDRPVTANARLAFDPINLLLEIFARRWPDKRVEVAWVSELKKDRDVWGCAAEGHGEEPWAVMVDVEAPFHAVIELVAHELAHVAVGLTHDDPSGHGEAWSKAFDELHEAYTVAVDAAYRDWVFYEATQEPV